MKTFRFSLLAIGLALAAVAVAVFTGSHSPFVLGLFQPDVAAGLLLANAAVGFPEVMKAFDNIEANMKKWSEKADGEMQTLGKVTADTKTALDNIGTTQRELADRILQLEQKGLLRPEGEAAAADSWGQQFVKAASYGDFAGGRLQRVRAEVKNTVTNTIGNTFSDRQPGMVGGAFRAFTLEALLTSLPTTSNAVDYVRENVFTNSAAEATEGAQKAESAITTTLVTEPVATVAHWIKISRQLANDNAALAAYIDLRMRYGVNLRVENQIIAGTGVAPNISGFTKAGNFTAHAYTDAALTALGLTAPNKIMGMIRKIIGDCAAGDYPADAILLNPADWANIEIKADTTGQFIASNPRFAGLPSLWGLPVVSSNAVTADTTLVGSLRASATFYNREGVVVDMSESDSDNFTKNLVTIRAERRCMLAVERPAAMRYGDLTPA